MAELTSVVIVGAGIAGVSAAAGLRAAGYDGRIVLIGDEPELPYRRPTVSKDLLRGDKTTDQVRIKPASWFDDQSVELVTGCRVSSVDPAARTVGTADGRSWAYDRLVLATGGRARRLGPDSPRVLTVRSAADVEPVRAALANVDTSGDVVVVGAGLIGSEIAAGARALGRAVTLLETAALPLPRLLPAELGRMYVDLHAEQGTELCTGVRITDVADDGERVTVTSGDGRRWTAAVVVVAIGMQPNTELAGAAGCALDDGVLVDAAGRTSVEGIYAAGDVANRPEPILGGRCRIEHWQGAQNHATAVGRAVAGEDVAFAEVPWCWSEQYGHNLQVTGWPEAADDLVLRGDLAARDFTAVFVADSRPVAAVSIGRPAEVRAVRAAIADRRKVDVGALADESLELAQALAG